MGRHFAWLVVALGLALGSAPAQLAAQERAQTLAELRVELDALATEVSRLRNELVQSPSGPDTALGGDLLQRLDRVEAALSRLTGQTEELEFRIRQIVADATNRIGDMEFRLVELEGGDPSALEAPRPLEGAPDTAFRPPPRPGASPAPSIDGNGASDMPATEAPLMAADEGRSFEAARATLEEGRAEEAAQELSAFVEAYPGGPFTEEAQLLLGRAHRERGALPEAARSFLNLFVADPSGSKAAPALLALGETLAEMGETEEACVMFEELMLRFPGSPEATRGGDAFAGLGCA